jgi:hypothetical protein
VKTLGAPTNYYNFTVTLIRPNSLPYFSVSLINTTLCKGFDTEYEISDITDSDNDSVTIDIVNKPSFVMFDSTLKSSFYSSGSFVIDGKSSDATVGTHTVTVKLYDGFEETLVSFFVIIKEHTPPYFDDH